MITLLKEGLFTLFLVLSLGGFSSGIYLLIYWPKKTKAGVYLTLGSLVGILVSLFVIIRFYPDFEFFNPYNPFLWFALGMIIIAFSLYVLIGTIVGYKAGAFEKNIETLIESKIISPIYFPSIWLWNKLFKPKRFTKLFLAFLLLLSVFNFILGLWTFGFGVFTVMSGNFQKRPDSPPFVWTIKSGSYTSKFDNFSITLLPEERAWQLSRKGGKSYQFSTSDKLPHYSLSIFLYNQSLEMPIEKWVEDFEKRSQFENDHELEQDNRFPYITFLRKKPSRTNAHTAIIEKDGRVFNIIFNPPYKDQESFENILRSFTIFNEKD